MDTTLMNESKKLNEALKRLEVETNNELQAVNKRLAELNELLASKEMATDRSENASYQIAVDDKAVQASLQGTLQKRIIKFAAAQTDYSPTGFIKEGTTIECFIDKIAGQTPSGFKNKFIIKLVDDDLSRASLGLVSVASKLGAALLLHQSGDTVEINTLKGNVQYRIGRVY